VSSTAVEDKTKKPSDQTSEIPALGFEQGVDSSLAYTTPFNPVGMGLKKTPTEDLNEVLKDEYDVQRPTTRQLVTMRRLDGHARALYRLLTLPIRASLVSATFKPADGGEAEGKFMENVFRTAPANGGMTTTFQRFIGQMLGALFEGFACFEKVFWIPTKGPLKGKVTLQKLAYRPSDTMTFVSDKTGGFAGLRQRAVTGGKVTDVFIEPEYAFYYAAQEDERKFYGVSFFESAFPHYDAKAKAYFTAHLAAQRAAVGTRIGTVPPNASQNAKTEFARNLSSLALAQWMMMPEGFKVEVLKEGGTFDFLNLINHHNHMMSESVLAAFFDADTGGGSGESGALVNFAKPGDDMFILMLRAIMDDVANQINHYIIPQLIDYNFDGGKYPTFTWGTFTDEQRAAIAATFDKLATAGQSANVSEEFMRELEKTQAKDMGLEIDWEKVEAREAEEKAAAAAQFAPGGVPGADPALGAGGVPGYPTAGPLGPDGQPLPPDPALEMSDEELASMNSLGDVIGYMADQADKIADSRGLPSSEEQQASQTAPTAGQPLVPAQPVAAPAVPGQPAAPAVPGQPPKAKKPKALKPGKFGKPPTVVKAPKPGQVALSGISDDMMDWADRMLALSNASEGV
jgi:hypothetical protein